jgi:hypothetical protein
MDSHMHGSLLHEVLLRERPGREQRGRGQPGRGQPGGEPLLHTPDRAGILYAEDFDSPEPFQAAPEPEPAAEAAFSSGEMEMARQTAAEAAVAHARAEWERSDAHACTLALCAVAAELTAAQEEGRALAEAAADGTVRAILTLAAGLLPAYCAGHGEAEVRQLLAHLLPALQREPRIAVRVSPAVAEAIRADLLLLDDDLAARVTVTAADMPPGDARVAWTDGSLVRDQAAIHAAMVAALAGLGLVDAAGVKLGNVKPGDVNPGNVKPAIRSLDHAQ